MSQHEPAGPGTTTIAVRAEGGHVLLLFPHPVAWAKLDPQTGYMAGEAIARAAHEARFGEVPPDGPYIVQQVRSRLTEQMRDLMIARVALMLQSMRDQNRSHGYQALQIVDSIFAEVA